jgi:hypothetical protein
MTLSEQLAQLSPMVNDLDNQKADDILNVLQEMQREVISLRNDRCSLCLSPLGYEVEIGGDNTCMDCDES